VDHNHPVFKQRSRCSDTSNNRRPLPLLILAATSITFHQLRQQSVQLSGNNGGAFSKVLNFTTSRTLKVKVEALSAPNLTVPGYTNWFSLTVVCV